jgi:hypothetical protein
MEFKWAWNDYAPWPDPSMTRAQAARLLRAWRRTSRNRTSMGTFRRSLSRLSPGVYRVIEGGESGTMFVPRRG